MQCQLIWLDIPVCEAIVDNRDQARVSRSVTIIWVEMIRWQITNSVFDQSKLIRSWADSGFGQRVESATWYYIYISCDPDNRFLRCPVFWITWTSPSRHPGRVALIASPWFQTEGSGLYTAMVRHGCPDGRYAYEGDALEYWPVLQAANPYTQQGKTG